MNLRFYTFKRIYCLLIPEVGGLYVFENQYCKIGRKEIYEFSENSKSEIR